MLKINLLPPSINRRKQVKLAAGVVGALLVAEVAFLWMARAEPLRKQDELTALAAERQTGVDTLNTLSQKAQTVAGQEQALAPKLNFINGLMDYNGKYAGLYSRVGRYTFQEVMFLNMAADQTTLNLSAYVSRPEHVARLMLGLSRNPDLSGIPQVSGVPNWMALRARQQVARALNRDADLAPTTIIGNDMPPPGDIMAGGDAGMMGGGGMGGGGNGAGGGGGMGGGMPEMGGGDMGGGGNTDSAGLAALRLARNRKLPLGFTVAVKCQLKKPIQRPTYGSSGNADAGGGGGGMPEMGGGMGGGGNGAGGGMMGGGDMGGGMDGGGNGGGMGGGGNGGM